MESTIRLFRRALLDGFFDWLETNKSYLGKWYSKLYNEAKKVDCDSPIKIMGTSLWMFNMMANCGVSAGMGPDGPKQVSIAEGLDEKTTKSLLIRIAACMNLQYLPPEFARQEILVITAKKFSLKRYREMTDAL